MPIRVPLSVLVLQYSVLMADCYHEAAKSDIDTQKAGLKSWPQFSISLPQISILWPQLSILCARYSYIVASIKFFFDHVMSGAPYIPNFQVGQSWHVFSLYLRL